MGYGNWNSKAYTDLSKTRATKPAAQIFTSKKIPPSMDPKGLKVRECRDSETHPESLGIMLKLDVTGSMGKIPETLAKGKLTGLMDTLHSCGIADAAVLFGAIGDHLSDQAPLQVGQFESGNDELDQWLTTAWIERGGGPFGKESYALAWLVAARHTSMDCFEKRGVKGFLFTVGDEAPWESMDVQNIMGYSERTTVTAKKLLEEAQKTFHVFHVHVATAYGGTNEAVIKAWRDILGKNLLILDNYQHISEVLASAVAVTQGVPLENLLKAFNSGVQQSVHTALFGVEEKQGEARL